MTEGFFHLQMYVLKVVWYLILQYNKYIIITYSQQTQDVKSILV